MTQPIVQMTMTRDELFLLEDLIPIWTEHADGFVFLLDNCTDGTYEFLMDNKEKYNILSVLTTGLKDEDHRQENSMRQTLFNEARKFTGKITCLDTDEYFDGQLSKDDLHIFMDHHPNVATFLKWIQYTDTNEVRSDGPWLGAAQDRFCNYTVPIEFMDKQRHAEHIPRSGLQTQHLEIPGLWISHLQWLDVPTVAVKQYYWKVTDYVTNLLTGVDIVECKAYDESVNDFNWTTVDVPYPLKISPDIYKKVKLEETYKYKEIKKLIKQYDVPNLGDWGMSIHE